MRLTPSMPFSVEPLRLASLVQLDAAKTATEISARESADQDCTQGRLTVFR